MLGTKKKYIYLLCIYIIFFLHNLHYIVVFLFSLHILYYPIRVYKISPLTSIYMYIYIDYYFFQFPGFSFGAVEGHNPRIGGDITTLFLFFMFSLLYICTYINCSAVFLYPKTDDHHSLCLLNGLLILYVLLITCFASSTHTKCYYYNVYIFKSS